MRALWQVIAARRDHRHFRADAVEKGTIERLLGVFQHAPSVGLSQPWHVTVVSNAALKEEIYQSFADVRTEEEQHFSGERRALYDTLKLEGIREAPVGLVISTVPPDTHTLGTTAVPTSLEYSVVTAITLLWLAATAEGLGVGWVSLVRPDKLRQAVGLPDHYRPLAYLCVGYPALDLTEPLLQTVGWAKREPLAVTWKD